MSSNPKYKTFVSCGTPYTDDQKELLDAVEDYLRTKGCEVCRVGTHNHSSRQPVEFARDLIANCDSAVVIAYERFRIKSGVEKPDSADESPINGRSEPTVWNQLEAALAYGQKLPILILVDRMIRRQGMLSKRFEWNGLEIDIDKDIVKQESFRQIVDDWLRRVDEFQQAKSQQKPDLEEITIGEFISGVKAKHAWAILVSAVTIIGGAFGLGFWLGQAITAVKP